MRTGAATFAIAALLCAGAAAVQAFSGTVTRVADGDTLWVQPDDAARRPLKLRLRGIDAPELCQRWGVQAREALAARVSQRRVSVDVRTRDDYGRALGTLRVAGTDVAEELVAGGHAWSQRWRGRGPYLQQEQMARAARRGLFADPAPIEPRQFRRVHGPCD
jgi:endonuclease YncB( thermonuclease family)